MYTGNYGHTDIFAFGMVLYELFTQRPLFSVPDHLVTDQIKSGKRPPIEHGSVPAVVKDVIESCWQHGTYSLSFATRALTL